MERSFCKLTKQTWPSLGSKVCSACCEISNFVRLVRWNSLSKALSNLIRLLLQVSNIEKNHSKFGANKGRIKKSFQRKHKTHWISKRKYSRTSSWLRDFWLIFSLPWTPSSSTSPKYSAACLLPPKSVHDLGVRNLTTRSAWKPPTHVTREIPKACSAKPLLISSHSLIHEMQETGRGQRVIITFTRNEMRKNQVPTEQNQQSNQNEVLIAVRSSSSSLNSHILTILTILTMLTMLIILIILILIILLVVASIKWGDCWEKPCDCGHPST